ncbi:gamma-glutamylcyclotransferase [Scytonema sp. UIC 10036]|uniref:gamma-glutamylcyclotransferase family protein n=1 Tax=Scytonema sp. UIC 10036 TaxID=2304196 RepID=UPI0012DA7F7A|nr:gamma-glutamylcyclotransferase [Scytonema sp. UIC 10036]MUG99041.1 gamma-glutamylcyclotransferase [Scytonema sp. UIC 10036]
MAKLETTCPGLLKVFVYGTLKPGEDNYDRYCAGKVVDATSAIAKGKLFALPMGYPAMVSGDGSVRGYLLSFADSKVLTDLDELEDYHPARDESENLYLRQQIEVQDLQGDSLGWAWVYIMTEELATQLGGIFLPDGWWYKL